MKNIKLLVSLFLLLSGVVYSQTSVQSFQIPTQTEKFSARFTASASVDNANIGIGFAGQEIENWSGMNCIVSFGGSGNIHLGKVASEGFPMPLISHLFALKWPCAAALLKNNAAILSSLMTPLPFVYIQPRANCALASLSSRAFLQ